MSRTLSERSRKARERGGARLRAIVWLLILGAAGYVAFKVVPIYVANYQLQDKLQTEARFATVNHKTDDQLRDVIYREMRDRDIPARREDIKILENTQRGVRLSVEYTVPVDLKLYQLQLHFNPSAENRSIY